MPNFLSPLLSTENFSLTPTLGHLCMSFLLNTLAVWVIVHFFYYPKGRRRDYYFTFILLSVSIFMLIALLLQEVGNLSIGAALGLFAIFGIIRYRTESVPIREMTYLFFLVALSVINGKNGGITFAEQVVVNVLFVLCVWICEHALHKHKEGCKYVKYDNIELIKPERYEELKADLEKRLGVKVNRVEVGAVDFLMDMTMLRVFYDDPGHQIKPVDREFKLPVEGGQP